MDILLLFSEEIIYVNFWLEIWFYEYQITMLFPNLKSTPTKEGFEIDTHKIRAKLSFTHLVAVSMA
jgi:hypothetical protein